MNAESWVHEADEVCPVCHLEACEDPGHLPPAHAPVVSPSSARRGIEDLGAFMDRVRKMPEASWIADGLFPSEGICLWHGQPRDMKSLSIQAATLDLASDRPIFGSDRFAVKPGQVVAYFTEEDPERLFFARMRWLTARAAEPASGRFFPFVRRALSFENRDDQEFIIETLKRTKATVAVFDPLRSFTGLSDKGPADFAPVVRFLRRIQNETACKTIIVIHHDTKPLAIGQRNAERSRSQDASGGGIFSVSDCPVHFEKIEWNRVAVRPSDYKASGDPKPFEVEFKTDVQTGPGGEPRFGSWVTAVSETKAEEDLGKDVQKTKILSFLKSEAEKSDVPLEWWRTQDEIADGAHVQRKAVAGLLAELLKVSKVEFAGKTIAKGIGKASNAKLWRIPDVALPGPSLPFPTPPEGHENPSAQCPSALPSLIGKGEGSEVLGSSAEAASSSALPGDWEGHSGPEEESE